LKFIIPESLLTTCGDWFCGDKSNNCNSVVSCGDCDSAFTCLNGVCIDSSSNCTDYKGLNYYAKDYAYNGSIFWDFCLDSKNLTEYTCNCDEGNCSILNITLECDGSCDNGKCIHEVIELGNDKDMSKYSDKQAFLVSDDDWKEILPLVPVAIWTNETNDVENNPLLVFAEENYNDHVLKLDKEEILEEYVGIYFHLIEKPLDRWEINGKSFDVNFNLSQEVFDSLSGPYIDENGYEQYHYLQISLTGVKPNSEEDWQYWDDFLNNLSFTFNGNNVESYNPQRIGDNFIFDIWLYNQPWNNDSIRLEGNNLVLEEYGEDYLIEEVKIYFDDRYIRNSENGMWEERVFRTLYCDQDRTNLCITDILFSDDEIEPGEEFTYTLIAENIRDEPFDFSKSDEFDYEIYIINSINDFIRFQIISDFENKVLNKGDKINMSFTGRSKLIVEDSFDADSIIYFLQEYNYF